jgi:hypothetical protein
MKIGIAVQAIWRFYLSDLRGCNVGVTGHSKVVGGVHRHQGDLISLKRRGREGGRGNRCKSTNHILLLFSNMTYQYKNVQT